MGLIKYINKLEIYFINILQNYCKLCDNVLQIIESISPANGKVIAKIREATPQEASNTVTEARKAWPQWVSLPAPTRGEIVRQIGVELRKNLKPLGRLVSLEMGIKAKRKMDNMRIYKIMFTINLNYI